MTTLMDRSTARRIAPAPGIDAGAGGVPVPVLRARDVTKHYGGVRALAGANLTITRPGVVHCLAGENGSGKSTLLNVLSGQVRPDDGSMELLGEPLSLGSPSDALRHGIAMVSQETALAPDLSVTENVLLGGRMLRRRGGIDWRASDARAAEVLGRLGAEYDPRRPVRDLRPDERQMVEIARALSMDARVLILDEPTSSLTDDETAALFRTVAQIKREGVSIVFVSHRLPEVMAISDEVTVLRDGRSVSSGPIERYDAATIVEAMVGDRELARRPSARAGSAPTGGEAVLQLRDVSTADGLGGVSIDVAAGEIVGLAGLVGSGRSELLEVLFGLRRPLPGATLLLEGKPFAPASPRAAIAAGLGYVPPDRKTQGLLLDMSVADNISVVSTAWRPRLAAPRRRDEARAVDEASDRMRIRAASAHVAAGTLSGGNQQKVALGKWLLQRPRILLLDEPTRGVDVAAKAEIHAQLREAAQRGVAMLVSSSEYDELLAVSDRIVVMFRGRVVGVLPAAEAGESRIAALAGGIDEHE
jgi:ABC-type sugar transport system ATPase subunit